MRTFPPITLLKNCENSDGTLVLYLLVKNDLRSLKPSQSPKELGRALNQISKLLHISVRSAVVSLQQLCWIIAYNRFT
jgi:hypothetical protein